MTSYSESCRCISPPSGSRLSAATFGARSMAMLIDLTILNCLYILLGFLLGIQVVQLFPPSFPAIVRTSIFYFLFLIFGPVPLAMVYFTFFHAWSGQTIGKMFLGLQAVSKTNCLMTPGKAFLRTAGYLVSALPAGAGFLWSVIDKEQCAWHDKLSDTHVIEFQESNWNT